LVLERRLEPREHVVQRLGEALDLVLRDGNRQGGPGGGGGEVRGLLPHLLARAKRRAGERVPGECCEQERKRRADEELLAKPLERLAARIEGASEDERTA